MIEGDFHVHSRYSFDSLMPLKDIVKVARKEGLKAIAVTDHETNKGGLEGWRICKTEKDFIVIPGVEVKTEHIDILVLGVREDIKSTRFSELVDEVKDKGGTTVLPHPYQNTDKSRYVEEIARNVDAIEILNGRLSEEKNRSAAVLVKETQKPVTAGSDAHLPREIGNVRLVFPTITEPNEDEIIKAILSKKVEIKSVGRSTPLDKFISQLIRAGKKIEPQVAGYAAKKYLQEKIKK